MKYFNHLTIGELWARTLQELDILHNEAQRIDAGLSATDQNALSTAVAALRRDGPLSEVAAVNVGIIQDLLDHAISRETLGRRNDFNGMVEPQVGVIGRVKVVPILSENGARLDTLHRHFKQILAIRDLLVARVDAELQIARLKAA